MAAEPRYLSSTHTESQSMLQWDTNTAAAAIVLVCLLFLVAVRKGFRGFVLNLGG